MKRTEWSVSMLTLIAVSAVIIGVVRSPAQEARAAGRPIPSIPKMVAMEHKLTQLETKLNILEMDGKHVRIIPPRAPMAKPARPPKPPD